jgi:hypothetical protein
LRKRAQFAENAKHWNHAYGGEIKGYADGGDVDADPLGIQTDPNVISQPFQMVSDDSQAQGDAATVANSDPASQSVFDQALTAPDASTAPQDDNSGPDTSQGMDYAQLLQGLRRGPSGMESAASGLAGLGDAIVQGVGRAGNPGFQRNLQESRQNMHQNLINALREKYESGYKGKELALGQQRANDENMRAAAALKETKEARRLTARQQDLAEKQHEAQLKYEQGKEAREAGHAATAEQQKQAEIDTKTYNDNKWALPGTNGAKLRDEAAARLQGQSSKTQASGPYGPTTVRNGKTYQWSPVSKQYHPVQ